MNDFRQNLKPVSSVQIDFDLQQLLKVLRKRNKVIILATLLITCATGLTNYFLIDPVYEAKTLLMVTVASEKLQVSTPVVRTDPTTETNVAMPVLTMNTYLGQLKSEAMMRRVLLSLNLPDSKMGSVSNSINASVIKDSNLIEVKVRNTDPQMALDIANAVSAQYLELTKQFMFSSVVVISPAILPNHPVSPNKQFNITMAFILGLALSTLFAFLLEILDNTLKTAEDITQKLDVPVLGMIPVQNGEYSGKRGLGDVLKG